MKPTKEFNKNHMRLQNFILYLVMTDKEQQKTYKQKKNIILSEIEGENKSCIK